MKDIIIIGTGKAGFLHYYSYKKFEKIGKIYFVNINGKIKNENRILEKHGYSKIFAKKNDVYVIHESDFTTNTKIREVIVVCENNIVVKGDFLFYDKNLNKLKDGDISVIQNNKVIYSENIDFDDNMYECLLDIYKYFNTGVISQKYKNEIKEFSSEMNLYL